MAIHQTCICPTKTLRSLPTELHSKVEILEGEIDHILEKVHQLGYQALIH